MRKARDIEKEVRVIREYLDGTRSRKEAAEEIGISGSEFRRMARRYEKDGVAALMPRSPKIYSDELKRDAAEAYINGRIAAYAHLFTELSPPIPEDKVRYFRANGHLLRGYTVAPHEPTPDELLTFVDDHEISGVNLAVKPRRKAPTQKKAGKSR